MSMFWRVVVINTGVLVAAVLALVFTPASVSAPPTAAELQVVIGGTLLVLALNVLLLRRVFGPLERLTSTMRSVDPHHPGRRVSLGRASSEVVELEQAFNDMLDRLEHERRSSGRRALAAQEGERGRVARELHDEVGQLLTAVVLALEAIAQRAPDDIHDQLVEVQETARAGVEQVREIARGLRPGALEELGLRSALTSLSTSFGGRTGLQVRHSVASDLPPLSAEQDLAIYRVAQESLTNIARHARARCVVLELSREGDGVVLRVTDDGCGIPEIHARATDGGVGGMRERARLAGGRLRVRALPERGTEVRLELWPSR
jgi:two-component system sensor histidine kinase UhpB